MNVNDITEQFRLEQAGMGYLQFHVAVAWMRTWLKANNLAAIEHGDPAHVSRMEWEVDDGEGCTFWLSFDHTSFGHLLYSLDRKDWCGIDMTYHPAEGGTSESNWQNICRRARSWRKYGPMGQVYHLSKEYHS